MITDPPYRRIAEDIRVRIRDGDLAEGQRLPSIKELADQWKVATATVRNALTWLAEEGYIRTSPRGTFVADSPSVAPTPHDRLIRVQRTGSILAGGETKKVTYAGLVRPPLYVAELFDLDEGDQLLRREYVTGRGTRRLALAVTWHPAHFGASVPELLSTSPVKGDDAIARIKEATGRQVKFGRDSMHGRTADEREASALGLPIGTAVLALVHEWSDEQGLIEYGEAVMPNRVTIGYEYTV
ncbi:GntR family transcriptional regulator [Streptosporangium saharense]|uniref:GntR family transcriptional regulator n=1 Tax=Streptosporangium saharense TaxID=1706840 RepID=UPI0036848463